MIQQVTFLGLGVMGYPMARHLHNAGFETHVFNRTMQKSQDWVNSQNIISSRLHEQVDL